MSELNEIIDKIYDVSEMVKAANGIFDLFGPAIKDTGDLSEIQNVQAIISTGYWKTDKAVELLDDIMAEIEKVDKREVATDAS